MQWEDFRDQIKQFLTISNHLNDGWTLHGNLDQEHCAYIARKAEVDIGGHKVDFGNETDSLEEQKIANDQSSLTELKNILKIEHHVYYHINYGVPVLCFNIFKDGSLLPLKEVWKIMQIDRLSDKDMLSILSQMEHPILNVPYFTLHPCNTSVLFETFKEKSANPLISWLSCVGPSVMLNLGIEYEKYIANSKTEL